MLLLMLWFTGMDELLELLDVGNVDASSGGGGDVCLIVDKTSVGTPT
jgi:hypothetical protein